MKTRLKGVLGVALTVVLLASLMVGVAVAPAGAADGAWTTFPTPRPGSLGGYIIAPQDASGESTQAVGPALLEKAVDSTLYAYWDVGEATNLYKSADDGRSWSRIGGGTTSPIAGAALIDIVCSTEDASILYVTDGTTVYRSVDGGASWAAMTAITTIAGTITSMDAGYNGGNHYVVVGTTTGTGGGEVYLKRDAFGSGWAAQNIHAGFDVVDVACSPNFETEANPQIVAVISAEGSGTSIALGGVGTAVWSTEKASGDSNFSVKLSKAATDAAGSVYAEFVPDTGTTLADLDDCTAGSFGFDYNLSAFEGPQLELRFDDPNSAGYVEVTLMPLQTSSGVTLGTWGNLDTLDATDSPAWAFYGTDQTGSALTGATSDFGVAAISTISADIATDNAGNDADDWKLTRVRVELWEAGARDCYIDDVVIDGKTYLSELGSYVTYQYGTGAWKSLAASAPLSDGPIDSADIAFPADYDSTYPNVNLYVAVDSGADTGDVFNIYAKTPYASGLNEDISSVAVAGSSGGCKLLAASADSNDVWRSTDNGALGTWLKSKKDPSGDAGSAAYVVMADDYYESGRAWVAKGGANGGLSLSEDSGVLWTQISMIDTEIDQINTLSFSPAYTSDSTLFMVGASKTGPVDSLWRYDGTYWERVHDTLTSGMTAINGIRFSPGFASDSAVFIADTDTPKVWRSTDGGTRFIPQSGAPTGFDDSWVVIDPATVIVGNGGSCAITANNGTTWSNKAVAGINAPVVSFAMSPDYESDSTLLMGDSGGGVFRSTNGGGKWSQIPAGVNITGGINTFVAFDADYASNSTVYAADAGNDSVYRLVVGTDTAWKQIDARPSVTWPAASTAGGALNGILAAPDGTLYVADRFATAGAATVADDFTIMDPTGNSDAGNIVVTGGSVKIYGNSATTKPLLADSPVTVAAGNAFAWETGTPATDAIRVEANANGTAGVWTRGATGAAVAGITTDTDGDASVAAASGAFSLPDAAGTGAAGTNHVVLRSVNPTGSRSSSRGVYFEPMAYGFTGAAANLAGLWYTPGSNALWTLESAAGASKIWTYTDYLTAAPELKSPADKADTGRTGTASLKWSALPTATKYEVWVSASDGFSTFAGGSPLFSATTSVSVSGLSAGRTYYWKVCSASNAGTPAGRNVSPWSATRSFTTGLSGAEWNPFFDAANVAPSPGAADVSVRPAFQWNPADWATGYEFELSANSGTTARGYFVEVVTSATGDNALVNCVWLCDRDLDYSTTYYWHVKAISAASKSVWSTGVFTTEAAPPAPEPPPPPPPPTPEPTTPGYIWAVIGIGAALCIAVIVLIVRTRRVI